MFTILHGDNILASRRELEVIKRLAKDKEILALDGKEVTLTNLKQVLETKSLFGQEKLVIIENLISTNKKQGTKKIIFNYLKKLSTNNDLILWEGKEIKGQVLSSFKNAKVKFFKTPAIIFKFLESLRPGNNKVMLSLLRSCSKREPIELIFYMIIRQFRLLLLVKDLGKEGVPGLANWQYLRLTNQANCFTMKELRKIYKKLLEIDFGQKTGQSLFDLEKTLELLIINL